MQASIYNLAYHIWCLLNLNIVGKKPWHPSLRLALLTRCWGSSSRALIRSFKSFISPPLILLYKKPEGIGLPIREKKAIVQRPHAIVQPLDIFSHGRSFRWCRIFGCPDHVWLKFSSMFSKKFEYVWYFPILVTSSIEFGPLWMQSKRNLVKLKVCLFLFSFTFILPVWIFPPKDITGSASGTLTVFRFNRY